MISERGDIPLQVRSEARRIQRELGWILDADPSSPGLPPGSPTATAPDSRSVPSGSAGWFA
nr:hypothetical protein [Streptomyces scabichelini]